MTKKIEKKEEAHKEDSKEEAKAVKKPNLVSLEMTEEQKEKVVKVLADEEAAKLDQAKAHELVNVQLSFGHSRNGVAYGPGWCQIPSDIAASLVAADHQALNSRIRENENSKHLIQILSRGQAKITKVEDLGGMG